MASTINLKSIQSDNSEAIQQRSWSDIFSQPRRALQKMRNFLPHLAIFGMGTYFSPSFRLGCISVAPKMALCECIGAVLKKLKLTPQEPDPNSEYTKDLISSGPILIGLAAPICEEVLFRLILQKIVGIVPASLMFGLLHAQNPHKQVIAQVVNATVTGLLFGYLAENYGIDSALAGHMLNNSLAYYVYELRSL